MQSRWFSNKLIVDDLQKILLKSSIHLIGSAKAELRVLTVFVDVSGWHWDICILEHYQMCKSLIVHFKFTKRKYLILHV